MGYAGGTIQSPTYRAMGDHTESFQVDFDPRVVTYEDLLESFWTTHDPLRAAYKVQYASLILAHDDAQLEAARASAHRLVEAVGRPVVTRIERLNTFWLAEDYHQKYYLRNESAIASSLLEDLGGDEDALRESTASAHINGYLAGYGSSSQLASEVELLSRRESVQAYLESKVSAGTAAAGCAIG